jgi:hypothetical protein
MAVALLVERATIPQGLYSLFTRLLRLYYGRVNAGAAVTGGIGENTNGLSNLRA